MVKAVFLDYTGTMVRDDDPYTTELIKIFLTQSDLKELNEALRIVWGLIKKLEWEHYQDTYIKKDEMVDEILAYCVENHNLKADLTKVHDIWRNSWIHAPLYDDVRPFVEKCPVPVYVVSNDDYCYLVESFEEKKLEVAGIVSAEKVRASKPHVEILQEALRMAGVNADEAVMIGDSETSDVECAMKVGITPILIDRKGVSKRDDIQVVRTLDEVKL